jgi:hypothetical protein
MLAIWSSASIALAFVVTLVVSNHTLALSMYPPGSTGSDVSWPKSNCSASPPSQASFGIVGATGGLDFARNNCLFSEASWFPHLALYMNTGYPGISVGRNFASGPKHCSLTDNVCLAYNYGFAAAEYGLLYAASQNVHSTSWWLDVETENSWTPNVLANRASIQGMIDAIKQNTVIAVIGIYSTPLQWKQITGNWRNNIPNWVGTGSTRRSDALAACRGNDFTGGGTQLTQYILQLDHDYVCR